MEETDDYESEILFYSISNQKRERDRLRRKFLLLAAVVVTLLLALILFDRFRTTNVFRRPDPLTVDSSNVDQPPIDQLDLPFVDNQPTNGEQRCRQPSYDYLQLAIRWPSSLCLFHHCSLKPDQWVMYSLRPTFYNGSYASACCDVSDFDIDRIAPLESLLSNRWPSLFNASHWKESMRRQFDRYGSCLGSGLTLVEQQRNRSPIGTSVPIQLHFVDVVRRLAQWLPDFRSRLEKSQLIPQINSDNLYALNSIRPSLGLNQTVVVQCSRYRAAGRVYSLLDTILLCFDRYNLQLIDCPNVVEDCSDRIFYPHSNAKLF
jgi:hypothetical protein